MIEVNVQVMAPVEAAPGSYDWTTIGVITDPESLDIDYLKTEILRWVRKSDYKPAFDVLRLVVIKDGKAEMKITLNDFVKQNFS